ncbi:HNH endonuclease [Vibrio spartinae]|uniref:HNH endonuclease n=1 Tax=Vibrio spartinae TaxID=1918945 RepID=A0A1N6MBI2_9VIBR|nr:HNH endonuclease signature motif containing protein [Vibrio spartinae]SIO96707.1 HNH endonuclease [Vibrio spartinae]
MVSYKGKNKFGLSRYIPTDIRKKIRRDAGFGCVVCGCVLIEYEHIEPEFKDASEHNPDNMTILCPICHDRVTKKIISKRDVWAAKRNPKGLQQGYVNDLIFPNTDELEFLLGSVQVINVGIIISIYGKPLFWFESSENNEEPFTICCIFYGVGGEPIAYINRNEYIALIKKQDIVSVASRLTISDDKYGCILGMSREGGSPIHITELYMQYNKIKVMINNENSPLYYGSVDTPDSNLNGFNKFVFSGGKGNRRGEVNAIGLSQIPWCKENNKICWLIRANIHGLKVRNSIGHHKGWLYSNLLINLKGEIVGYIKDGKAFNVFNEFISNYKDGFLSYPEKQYDDGEPIFIPKHCRQGIFSRTQQEYDLSYRFFGF